MVSHLDSGKSSYQVGFGDFGDGGHGDGGDGHDNIFRRKQSFLVFPLSPSAHFPAIFIQVRNIFTHFPNYVHPFDS